MDIFTATTDDLFSMVNSQSEQMESLANQSLGYGIDKYVNKDYKGAVLDFKRALGLSPHSEYSVDAIKYLAMSHQKLDEPEKAIAAYEQGVQLHPDNDELQTGLGNLYFAQGRTGEAIMAYEAAVRLYDDANNRFSLGQGYLKAGRHDDAAEQFKNVIRWDPNSPNGYFGLGQALAARKKYSEAITQFERAIHKDKDFHAAVAEMGYTYADAGNLDKAKQIQSDLEYKDVALSQTLSSYISKQTQPEIMLAWGNSTFSYYLPPKTTVAALSDYLTNANTSQSFSMLFQFNKAMDRDSIENPVNWNIRRSSGNGPGMDYNFRLPIPETEARIMLFPTNIYYDDSNFTALVRFTVSQNASANATIDPSHLEFSFRGIDADGNDMDPDYDQYMGFSGSF